MAMFKNLFKRHRVERESIVSIDDFEKRTGVKFNRRMTGKMADIICLSTSCKCNKYCQERAKDPSSICHYCFAEATMNCRKDLRVNMERNTEILTTTLFEVDEFPLINAQIVRFESWGDINNVIQCRNYFRLCKRNPFVRFALWTKNPGFVAQAIKAEGGKPENLNIVYSSPYVNVRLDPTHFDFIDKVFTVYSDDFATENNVCINCGGRSCLACQRCYRKDTERDIAEILK